MNHKLIFYCICMLLFTSWHKTNQLVYREMMNNMKAAIMMMTRKNLRNRPIFILSATKCREISQPASS